MTNDVLIITSAAYPEPELEAEFGKVPPAFLPVGNRRLFVHQCLEFAGRIRRFILSLPEDFEADKADVELLHHLGVEMVRVPAGLSLGQSLVFVINMSATSNGPICVLHGDTLLRGLDLNEADVVSVADAPAEYNWGAVPTHAIIDKHQRSPDFVAAEANEILSGYFSFADASLLIQTITRRGGDFIAGLDDYSIHRPLRVVRASEWLDFGHANTFHQSRQRMTTERKFNTLDFTRRSVTKSGADRRKIQAEASWFEHLPFDLRIFVPAFLGSRSSAEDFNYTIEYLHLPTLSDLFVFGRLTREAWRRIFEACDEFLSACVREEVQTARLLDSTVFLGNTMERLETFSRQSRIDLKAPCRLDSRWLPSLERMAQMAADTIPRGQIDCLGRVHGDFCFSNILYDSRAEIIRVIDPRGLDLEGKLSQYGDVRYDIGKLYHSVHGRYDHIVAGYYKLVRHGELNFSLELSTNSILDSVESEFGSRKFAGITPVEANASAIGVLLFLSMLPLHTEDSERQLAFAANAMRLFLELDLSKVTSRAKS